ncbi:MAG: IS5/IS1182 family transposase [Cytophaga sp.]|nr:IS5/IS1182 family transposase [Undibacterium sp.]
MQKPFFDTPIHREFAQLEEFGRLPDESPILRFRSRLENYKMAEQIVATVNELLTDRGLLLKVGTEVDAILIVTLIAARNSTKNICSSQASEMHSTKKSRRLSFRLKTHIGMDAVSGLVNIVACTCDHFSDIVAANALPIGKEGVAFRVACYQGVEKRPDAKADVPGYVAIRLGERKALSRENKADAMIDNAEKLKAGIRTKVEDPPRAVQRQFGFVKACHRRLKRNAV